MIWSQSNSNIWVAAHRGYSEKYPENTMLAFEKAVEVGVDQIETDVRITKDGELVLIHDKEVDRTTDGTGLVRDYTLSELQKLDAGSGRKIPTFIEFMEYVKTLPRMTLDIELKEYPINVGETAYDVCDRVIKIIEDYGYGEKTVFNSFSPKLHEYIRTKYGDRYKQHLYFPYTVYKEPPVTEPLSYAYCMCMFSTKEGERVSSLEDCKKVISQGVQAWAGASVKTEKDVDEVIQKGCSLITSNNPEEILRILRLKNARQENSL